MSEVWNMHYLMSLHLLPLLDWSACLCFWTTADERAVMIKKLLAQLPC